MPTSESVLKSVEVQAEVKFHIDDLSCSVIFMGWLYSNPKRGQQLPATDWRHDLTTLIDIAKHPIGAK